MASSFPAKTIMSKLEFDSTQDIASECAIEVSSQCCTYHYKMSINKFEYKMSYYFLSAACRKVFEILSKYI